jgi:hypothetical protein
MSKEKLVKKKLKLAQKHPNKVMRLGRHLVKPRAEEFELNESEVKELESKTGQAWFMKEGDKPAKKVKKVNKES